MCAFRHRFPSYAGIFKPRLALHLIVINQCLRAGSIVAVGVLFFYATLQPAPNRRSRAVVRHCVATEQATGHRR
jgi:hypothetical protein